MEFNIGFLIDANYNPSMETIAEELYDQFGYDTIIDLELEWLAAQVAKQLPTEFTMEKQEVIDTSFFPKLDCILALIKNPYEVTNDLFAFVNTILVCNDKPICGVEIEYVPPRYIEHGIETINKILPKDMNIADVYWHSNIQKYMFHCYSNDSNYILPDTLLYLENDFLDSALKNDNIRSKMKSRNNKLRPLIAELIDTISKRIDNIRERILVDDHNQDIITTILDLIEESSDFSASDELAIRKCIMCYLYKTLFNDLR